LLPEAFINIGEEIYHVVMIYFIEKLLTAPLSIE